MLSDNGYSIILKNTGNSRQKEARFLEELISKGIDGLIIEPSKSELLCRHVSLYETLDKYQIPYIFIQGLYTEMQEKPHILIDDAGGGYLVTKHLLDSGRRNIAGFFKADDSQGIERHKGYVKALQEHEIAYDPDKVVWFHTRDREESGLLWSGTWSDRTALRMGSCATTTRFYAGHGRTGTSGQKDAGGCCGDRL